MADQTRRITSSPPWSPPTSSFASPHLRPHTTAMPERLNRQDEMDPVQVMEESPPPYSELPPSFTQTTNRPALMQDNEIPRSSVPAVPAHDTRLCANCNCVGHDLSICVGPSASDGAIHGRPICNMVFHLFDDCPRAVNSTQGEGFFFLVVLRGNRPPIRTSQNYLQMAVDMPSRDFYPWTRLYSQGVPASTAANFDYSRNNPRELPSDPATSSQQAIRQNLDLILEIPLTIYQLRYMIRIYDDGNSSDSNSDSSS